MIENILWYYFPSNSGVFLTFNIYYNILIFH